MCKLCYLTYRNSRQPEIVIDVNEETKTKSSAINRHSIKLIKTITLEALLNPSNAEYTPDFFEIIDVYDQ